MDRESSARRGMKIFFLIYFGVLILLLTGIGVMGWLGYDMIDAGVEYVLFGMLLVSALIAGAVWIVRRIGARIARITVGAICGALILALSLGMIYFFTLMLAVQLPQPYTTLESPDGRSVVVLRRLSADEARVEARVEALGADWDPEQGAMDIFVGYRYAAHPRVARFFYERDASAGGELEIGLASGAQLMYEWPREDELRLYVEGAEAGDGGELRLKLEDK